VSGAARRSTRLPRRPRITANSFDARAELEVGERRFEIFRLDVLRSRFDVARLPFSLKVLLENLLRTEGNGSVGAADIEALASWDASAAPSREISFSPARVLMQDFTGVPAVVDLAAMRDAMAKMGGDPAKINPLAPAELVIDHSVQVDVFGTHDAFQRNAEREFERNQERYAFLRWGQDAFHNLRVVPPDTGIVHQVNLEYLARVVFVDETSGRAYPDTLVGTDSHTTMVNGLGVLGWGVGGIEAEAAMLGQPMSMLIPQVIGFQLHARASSVSSSSSTAPASRACRWPTGRRSATCRPSSARPARSSRSTPRPFTTSSSRVAPRSRSSSSRHTRASRVCGTTPIRPRPCTRTRSRSTSARSSPQSQDRSARRIGSR
jgi:hypothetical protein